MARPHRRTTSRWNDTDTHDTDDDNNDDNDYTKGNKRNGTKQYPLSIVLLLLMLLLLLITVVVGLGSSSSSLPHQREERNIQSSSSSRSSLSSSSSRTTNGRGTILPPGFDTVWQRARDHSQSCRALQSRGDRVISTGSTDTDAFTGFDTRSVMPFHNDTVASLPSFGILSAIQTYFDSPLITGTATGTTTAADADTPNDNSWPTCQMPPVEECSETQLTVIFMAYNPDRLGITMKEIKKLLNPATFHNLVKEIVLVWNGERHVDESVDGVALLALTKDHPVRIVYPLRMGLPNDLMNRYHPDVVVPTTKALLYYDDDGPFYSYEAVQGGFELWRRHANAQIGAMARQITYSARQQQEQLNKLGETMTTTTTTTTTTKRSPTKSRPADDQFISHCTNVDDVVDYQFRFFANYDANMVLPSGSMLHANYLCYLWHPVFAEIRRFVLMHPVHPDDMTVSMIVSQLAGVAPRVYSRRLDKKDDTKASSAKTSRHQQRRLSEQTSKWSRNRHSTDFKDDDDGVLEREQGLIPLWAIQEQRRSLMFSICWDCGAGMTEMKQYWAELRTEAVNSLVRYFGSLNSGSIGWCAVDSPYYNAAKDGRCDPVMAKQGWLPWMNTDGTSKDTCP